MNFQLTPDVAQAAAIAVAANLESQGYLVEVEQSAWPNTPLRTTLVGRRKDEVVLIEAQKTPSYHESLKDLVRDMVVGKYYATLYIATFHDSDMKAGFLRQIQKDGVGLLLVDDDGTVTEAERARNHALIIVPDQTLKLGDCKEEVLESIEKFNNGNRKDALRDMCELVERETENLAVTVARRGMFRSMTETHIRSKNCDWSSQIDALESANTYNPGVSPVIDSNFKTDLHSFRSARNLVGHKAVNRRADARREKQYTERMMQGPRLLAELISIRRRLR